jgi:hypothetical protein
LTFLSLEKSGAEAGKSRRAEGGKRKRDGLKPAPTAKSKSKIQKERGHDESCPYKGGAEIGVFDFLDFPALVADATTRAI